MENTNQDIIIAIVVGVLFIILFGFLMLIVIVNYVRRKKKMLIEKQIRETKFQQDLMQAQIEMQENTLKAISLEIHDNVGQILSLAKVNLSILTFNDNSNEKLVEIKNLIGKAINDLRNLSTAYNGQNLVEMGIINAIKNELTQLEKTGLFSIHFNSELTEIEIEKNKIIFLYRMIQEILNNILKHSEAKNINVTIFKEKKAFHLIIADDGKGFDTTDVDFKPGIGLNSIQKRAAIIEANLIFKSIKNKGTIVELIF